MAPFPQIVITQVEGSPVQTYVGSTSHVLEHPSESSVSPSSHPSVPLINPSPHIPSQDEGVPEQDQ